MSYPKQQIKRIQEIYEAIDLSYQSAALYYNFSCNGCIDNCCSTRFFHYTHGEAIYLLQGFYSLDSIKRAAIIELAVRYEEFYSGKDQDMPFMCPLNSQGLCVLYKWRPMICRLHGLPYETQDINLIASFHGGCERFMSLDIQGLPGYRTLNRSIYYREMAKAEAEIRKTLNMPAPQPRTVSSILLTDLYKDLGND